MTKLNMKFLESCPLLVVLRTFSKAYGLAGLRIGYGFASERIIDGMNLVRQPFNANYLAQVGASAALDDDEFVNVPTLSIFDWDTTWLEIIIHSSMDFLFKRIIQSFAVSMCSGAAWSPLNAVATSPSPSGLVMTS